MASNQLPVIRIRYENDMDKSNPEEAEPIMFYHDEDDEKKNDSGEGKEKSSAVPVPGGPGPAPASLSPSPEGFELPEDADERGKSTLSLSEPAQVTFRDLTFTVKVTNPLTKEVSEKQILKQVSGIFKPARLVAIMGASGAGKTSLLNCLAGYANTGVTTGNVFINSEAASIEATKRVSAYVFQDDVIMSSQTVREAITLAAVLKLPKDSSMEAKIQRVDEIINVLHLNKAQHSMIGSDRVKGISGGERRRTSLGMQMVTNPSILFLDEPTSGLDTFTAYTVIKILKSVANRHGKTVIATIHQPSSEIFHMFDDLVLMADGHIVYQGPAKAAMPYFAARGFPCPIHHNPSDHFFNKVLHDVVHEEPTSETTESESSGSEMTTLSGDASKTQKETELADKNDAERHAWLIDQWKSSDQARSVQEELGNLPPGGIPTASATSMAPFGTQFSQLSLRAFRNMLRDPLILKAKFGQTLVFSLIVGLLYLNVTNSQVGIQNRLGALFFIAVQMLFGGSMSIMTIFGAEKAVLLREHGAGLYGLPAYFLSRNVVEIPSKVFFPFMFGTISYWMVGFQNDAYKYGMFVVTIILVDTVGGSLGLFLATLFPDIRVAMAVMPMILLPLMIFSGFFINASTYPVYLGWLEWISPMKYAFVSIVKGEFQGLSLYCNSGEYVTNKYNETICPVTMGEQKISLLGFDNQPSQSVEMVSLFIMFCGLLFLSYFALWNSVRTLVAGKH